MHFDWTDDLMGQNTYITSLLNVKKVCVNNCSLTSSNVRNQTKCKLLSMHTYVDMQIFLFMIVDKSYRVVFQIFTNKQKNAKMNSNKGLGVPESLMIKL